VESLGVRWTFSGELVLNANYNSHTMVVGSIPGFVQIRPPATTTAERRSNTGGGLRVGLELSWWATQWVDNPTATALRVETAVLYAF
jgi:hypothetical protein